MALSRRSFLALSGVGAITLGIGSCTWSITRPIQSLGAPPRPNPPVSEQISPRIRLHMLQTGWVAVKREHRSFSGPSGLRIPAIMTSRSWTEWMPITAYAIEHPDGVFMVDTGETSQIGDPDYTACDAVTGMFYRRNLQFAVSSDEGVARQLNAVDIDPKRVSTVVMTHLHSDHMGGMASFGQARFIIAGAARAGHAGALMCRIPSNLNISTTEISDRPAGVFPQSMPLTGDGSVTVIPTPGHTRGHQSVLIEDGGTSVCIVGDAAFSLNQIENGEIAGIVETVADARATIDNLRLQVREFGTIMLPAHDPDNAARLKRFT